MEQQLGIYLLKKRKIRILAVKWIWMQFVKHKNKKTVVSLFVPWAEKQKWKEPLLFTAVSWKPRVWSGTSNIPPTGVPSLDTGQQRPPGRPRIVPPRLAQLPRPLQSWHQRTKSQHPGEHVCPRTCHGTLMLSLTLEVAAQAHRGRKSKQADEQWRLLTSFNSSFLPPRSLSHFLSPIDKTETLMNVTNKDGGSF